MRPARGPPAGARRHIAAAATAAPRRSNGTTPARNGASGGVSTLVLGEAVNIASEAVGSYVTPTEGQEFSCRGGNGTTTQYIDSSGTFIASRLVSILQVSIEDVVGFSGADVRPFMHCGIYTHAAPLPPQHNSRFDNTSHLQVHPHTAGNQGQHRVSQPCCPPTWPSLNPKPCLCCRLRQYCLLLSCSTAAADRNPCSAMHMPCVSQQASHMHSPYACVNICNYHWTHADYTSFIRMHAHTCMRAALV